MGRFWGRKVNKARKIRWQRQNFRKQVVPEEIRGLITDHSRKTHYPFLIWDVSEDGIGLWVSSILESGDDITLTIGQPYLMVLRCKVKWCEQQNSVPGYRCGLEIADDNKKILNSLISNFAQIP